MNVTQDKFWGFVLIGLGVAAIAFQPFDKVDAWLKGTTDSWLSFVLILLAAGAVAIAIFGRPSLKALAIFWIITP